MDMDYLKPGFDPSSLKVAQLRRILVENGVDVPSQSKKSALVGLFEQRVKPEIPKLRTKYENLLPSDKGIVKVKKKRDRQRKKKKDKSSGTDAVALSGSENYDADGNSSTSGKPDQVSDLKASTPFSDVNEFQQASGSKKKSRKRKIVEEEPIEDKEGDVDMSVKVEDRSHDPETVDKKRRRKIGEGEHTPITEKVAQKTPKKSPHKSLSIDKFETSSSSDSSFNESSILNVSRRGHAGTERSDDQDVAKNDFSFERRTLAPDLDHLKVSQAFADELKLAYKENSVPVLARPESHSELEMNYISGPAEASLGKETSIEVSTTAGTLPQSGLEVSNEDLASFKENEQEPQPVMEQDSSDSHSDLEIKQSQRITTPQLPTEDDVLVCEERAKEVEVSAEQVAEDNQVLQTNPSHFRTTFLKPLGGVIRSLSLFSLIVVPILYGLWYREQRIHVGYCGHEVETGKLFDSSIPALYKLDEFLEGQKPNCLPCPDHAICYPLMQMKCQPEYALQRNSWNLHHLLPLGDRCVKDTKREKLVSEVVKKSLAFLRMKNAQYSCGECKDDSKSGMTEEELYQIFYESRAPWINDKEFDELWSQAISDLIEEPEITWRQVSNNIFSSSDSQNFNTNNQDESLQLPNGRSSATDSTNDQITTDGVQGETGHLSETDSAKETRILRSTSKKYIGLRCKFEREIYQTYNKYAFLIWAMTIAVTLVKYTSYKIRKYYKQREVVEELSKRVLSKLKAVKLEGRVPEFLSVVQLRDVLLADITDLSYKNKLWQAVAKTLERNNTNVHSTLMEIHGEIMKCWEWVGPIEASSTGNNSHKDEQQQH